MWAEPLAHITSGTITLDAAVDLAELARELEEAEWFVGRCDCAQAVDKATLIHAIAKSLNFPEWTGRNWDALADALTDLSWIDEQRIAIVITDFGKNPAVDSATWSTATEIVSDALAWWRDHEKDVVVLMARTEK